MATNQITQFLKFANLQMAAESLFGFDAVLNPNVVPESKATSFTVDDLIKGNRHASKFTSTLAGDFAKNWKVVEHISNTKTGFSGTLFQAIADDPTQGIHKGDQVLSFRSTEFIDDAVRDNQATNTLEIKEKGFAFGQIADMENWYASLKNRSLLGNSYAVTGYSLGGHLATAFNQMRLEDGTANQIDGTYTFNGAGTGLMLKDATGKPYVLKDVIAQFDRQRQNLSGNEISFGAAALNTLYGQLRQIFNGQKSFAQLANPVSQAVNQPYFSPLNSTQGTIAC